MTTTTTNAGPTSRDWGRLANRAYEQHFLPDEVAEPAVNAAMSAYHDAVGAFEAAKSESGTTMTEADAERADRQALADLLEKGKDSTATPNKDKFAAERAVHERKLSALALIVNRREADLRRTLDDHRQALIDAHTANADKLAAEVMAGLDKLAKTCNELGLELRKAEWAAAFPDRWRGRPRTWTQGLIVDRPRGWGRGVQRCTVRHHPPGAQQGGGGSRPRTRQRAVAHHPDVDGQGTGRHRPRARRGCVRVHPAAGAAWALLALVAVEVVAVLAVVLSGIG